MSNLSYHLSESFEMDAQKLATDGKFIILYSPWSTSVVVLELGHLVLSVYTLFQNSSKQCTAIVIDLIKNTDCKCFPKLKI